MIQAGFEDEADEYFRPIHLPSPADLIWYWLQHCLPGKIGEAASLLNDQLDLIESADCDVPSGHPVTPRRSYDPTECMVICPKREAFMWVST